MGEGWGADWLPVGEALARVLAGVRPLPAEDTPLDDALGRTLAEEVISPVDQPAWNNAAMDGYAVRAADVRGARREAPRTLAVTEEVAAGGFPTRAVEPGTAIRVMTGAPVPAGADTVVRVEDTEAAAGAVRILTDRDAGCNVRARGEDVRRGDAVLAAGSVLRPWEIGVLATVGRARVRTHRRPRVAILANGDELASLEEFDEVLAGRKVVNSNSHALAAAVRAAGCEPRPLGIARDDEGNIRELLAAGLECDAIVTVAGASVGEHDLVKRALAGMGFQLDFWRVRMKPGNPFSFGHLVGVPVFGLPGNPVSAGVTFEVLVHPALRRMLGRSAVHSPTIAVATGEALEPLADRVQFVRVRLEQDAGGTLTARRTGPQGSGILSSLARADALLVVPAGGERIPAGTHLAAIPLPAPDKGRVGPGF
jgi:molybdopterin molybdotransferase